MYPTVQELSLPSGLMAIVAKAKKASEGSVLGVVCNEAGDVSLRSWSSPKDLLRFASPVLDALVDEVRKQCGPGDWDVCAWANELAAGDEVRRHSHSRSHLAPEGKPGSENTWAAIYYVRCDGGKLIFHDLDQGDKAYEPKSGQLYFFPADLEHSVPFNNASTRVSIAFSVRRRP